MVRGVLFDLDGTLVDSYDAITEALNSALDRLGLPLKSPAEVRRLVGGGVRDVMRKAAGERYIEEGVRLFRERYDRIVLGKTRPMPRAVETVREVRSRGYRVGVGTNKPSDFSRRIVTHLGLGPVVEAVVGPAEVERPKPDPGILLRLLEILRLRPEEAVYVGDMPLDVRTARAAGVAVWLVTTGSATEEEGRAALPDLVLPDLAAALDYLPPLAAV